MAVCDNAFTREYVVKNLVPTLCRGGWEQGVITLCRGGRDYLVPEFIHKSENNTYGPCAGQPCAKFFL